MLVCFSLKDVVRWCGRTRRKRRDVAKSFIGSTGNWPWKKPRSALTCMDRRRLVQIKASMQQICLLDLILISVYPFKDLKVMSRPGAGFLRLGVTYGTKGTAGGLHGPPDMLQRSQEPAGPPPGWEASKRPRPKARCQISSVLPMNLHVISFSGSIKLTLGGPKPQNSAKQHMYDTRLHRTKASSACRTRASAFRAVFRLVSFVSILCFGHICPVASPVSR